MPDMQEDDDEKCEQDLKAPKVASAERAAIARSGSGRRADKPTYVDPRTLDRISIADIVSY